MKPPLEELRAQARTAARAFLDLIATKFPGRDLWDWYRACAAIAGENVARNDDQSQDAAMAADPDIEAAYNRSRDALHAYYTARDGEAGFLGNRGL